MIERLRSSSPALRILVGLLALGVGLRIVAIVTWWPVTPTLEDGYQRFISSPFLDPQHPVGYALILGVLGAITRQIAFTVLVQHLAGIASAILLGAATRRVTGSLWPALLPAGIVLLDSDQIFLEHSIMSETWAVLAIALGLYTAVRAADERDPWWRWPLLCGVALSLAVTIRTTVLPLVVVAGLAIVAWPPQTREMRWAERPRRWRWPIRLRPLIGIWGAAIVLLVGFAAAGAAFGRRFGIEPSPGWYLYGRVSQFADCRRFTPPPGTARLCESGPPSQRPSAYFYTFDPHSPALKLFGAFGRDDNVVGGWARRALVAQFGDFLDTAWIYLRSYYVPSSLPAHIRATSTELDPQLDFANEGNPIYVAAMHQDLESYYDRFTQHSSTGGLDFLRGWQRVIRFGATALVVTTLLTLIGLIIGTRRSRWGVFLFGVGGLSLLIGPALTGTYSGRYTVPLAGPLTAAAGVTLWACWRAARARRR